MRKTHSPYAPEYRCQMVELVRSGRTPDHSRRPHHSPSRRVHATEEQCILSLRKGRLGIKRLRNELHRLHGIRLSVDTIHKVLCRHGLNQLKRPKLVRKGWKRYSRPVPGDRVQMDVCKIGPEKYQYISKKDVPSIHSCRLRCK